MNTLVAKQLKLFFCLTEGNLIIKQLKLSITNKTVMIHTILFKMYI